MRKQTQAMPGEVPLFDFAPATGTAPAGSYSYRCVLCGASGAVEPGECCDDCSGIGEYREANRRKATKAAATKKAAAKPAAKKATAKKAATKKAVAGKGVATAMGGA